MVSCAPDSVADVLAVFQRHGFSEAAVVGHMGQVQSSRLMVS
jgi:hypothetical protein